MTTVPLHQRTAHNTIPHSSLFMCTKIQTQPKDVGGDTNNPSCSDYIKNVTLVCLAAEFLIAQNQIWWLNISCEIFHVDSIHLGSPSIAASKQHIINLVVCVWKSVFLHLHKQNLTHQPGDHAHSRSLAPLIHPRPHASLCQSVLVLWIPPHVFFHEHHQHLPQSSLRTLRCNLLCFPFYSCPPLCHGPVFLKPR